jgi:hypothetical protein
MGGGTLADRNGVTLSTLPSMTATAPLSFGGAVDPLAIEKMYSAVVSLSGFMC